MLLRLTFCLGLIAGGTVASRVSALASTRASQPPIRALMLCGVSPSSTPELVSLVKTELPREGVNTLILQVDYNFEYRTHPELIARPAFSYSEVRRLVRACQSSGIQLIPLLDCLGHQSWKEKTGKLLQVYPQFDETPGLYPKNKGIYCRSYCPNAPGLHPILFDLLGELADAFESKAVHVGMDEVFILGDKHCPRCRGKNKAQLFAAEVRRLHEFLKSRGLRMWMWGDRLLDGQSTGLGKWEASTNGTFPAVNLIPKDIVICDWHYDSAPDTALFFAKKGFDVVSCSYNKPRVARAQAENLLRWRAAGHPYSRHLLGVMATNWSDSDQFVAEYLKAANSAVAISNPAVRSARTLFTVIRGCRLEAELHGTAGRSAAN